MLRKNEPVASPSTRLTWSTPPTNGTTPTSTVPVMPILSRFGHHTNILSAKWLNHWHFQSRFLSHIFQIYLFSEHDYRSQSNGCCNSGRWSNWRLYATDQGASSACPTTWSSTHCCKLKQMILSSVSNCESQLVASKTIVHSYYFDVSNRNLNYRVYELNFL